MKKIPVLALFALTVVVSAGSVHAAWRKNYTEVRELNKTLQGQVLDYTNNHGVDHRIWSRSLGQRRDLYVYLPPRFDPRQRYPVMIFLHGMGQDEQIMFDLAPMIDKAIIAGDLPPLIVAVPDGTVRGMPEYAQPTFFLNTNLGDFEDYIVVDLWDFLRAYFPIRCEREAHVLTGYSMGGFAAYSIGLRNRCTFATLIGIHPPLNLRWMDECGHYKAKFNPYHWGWRTNFDTPHEVVGSFSKLPVHVSQLIQPLWTNSEEAIVEVSRNNPIELVERTCLRNGEVQMYVAYGGRDEFNVDAQVESFFYLCKFKRIYVGIGYDGMGHHDFRTFERLWPGMICWLKPRITTVPVEEKVCQQVNVARKTAPAALPAALRPSLAMQPGAGQPAYPLPGYPMPGYPMQPSWPMAAASNQISFANPGSLPNGTTAAVPAAPSAAPAAPTAPAEIVAEISPQPITTYWAPGHFAPVGQAMKRGANVAADPSAAAPTMLPDIGSPRPTLNLLNIDTAPKKIPRPPANRADLGPLAPSAISYGVHGTDTADPPSPTLPPIAPPSPGKTPAAPPPPAPPTSALPLTAPPSTTPPETTLPPASPPSAAVPLIAPPAATLPAPPR